MGAESVPHEAGWCSDTAAVLMTDERMRWGSGRILFTLMLSYTNLFCYFVDSVAADRKVMNSLKKLGSISVLSVLLKADVEPSQSLKAPHHLARVLMAKFGCYRDSRMFMCAGPARSCSCNEVEAKNSDNFS